MCLHFNFNMSQQNATQPNTEGMTIHQMFQFQMQSMNALTQVMTQFISCQQQRLEAAQAPAPQQQPPAAIQPVAAPVSPFRPFNAEDETWTEYSQQLDHYFKAHNITGDLKLNYFLSIVGTDIFRLVQKLFPECVVKI